ncbi:putative phospholipid-transporting ATPase 9, partial [Tanacetum coccineum]
VTYEAESLDEGAFVIAARELGFEFYKRIQTTVSFMKLDRVSKKKVESYGTIICGYDISLSKVP